MMSLTFASKVNYADHMYHYDEADSTTGCTSSHSVGRLTRRVKSTVSPSFCCDPCGNLTQKWQVMSDQSDTTTYAYSAGDRLSDLIGPDGTEVQYTRNAEGRITSVSVTPAVTILGGSPTVVASNITYLPFGPVASYTLGSGQTVTRSYDANYQLTDLASPALNLHFARDAMGDITAIGNAVGASPATETYSYDPRR